MKYNNSATVTLWGQVISDSSEEKFYADINIAAKTYRVDLYKTDSATNKPLAGATFGLFNKEGGLIDSGQTDADGGLYFETNLTKGIVLREHELYYLQEINAPAGYQLKDTKYWFCFCNEDKETCTTCETVMEGREAFRIPFNEIRVCEVTNEYMNYNLPATGGIGVIPIMVASTLVIFVTCIYGFVRRRKREGGMLR